VLRGIFGPKRDEVIGGWRKLQNEFHNLFYSPNIRVIKSRIRRAGHAERMRDEKYVLQNCGSKVCYVVFEDNCLSRVAEL
jgi:hypothetical protein